MMSEASTIRLALICTKFGSRQAAIQISEPADMASQGTLRPWKRRAALQIMPQARKRRALGTLDGRNGMLSPKLHSAAAHPPIR